MEFLQIYVYSCGGLTSLRVVRWLCLHLWDGRGSNRFFQAHGKAFPGVGDRNELLQHLLRRRCWPRAKI